MRQKIIYTLDKLRERCDVDGQHWLWRNVTSTPSITRGSSNVPARRAARELADGKRYPRGVRVMSRCGHFNCISPLCSFVHPPATPTKRAKATPKRKTAATPFTGLGARIK